MQKILAILFITVLLLGCNKVKENKLNPNSAKVISFDKNEIRYNEKIYHKTYGKCNTNEDCAEIKITFPEIISNGIAYDSINNYIISKTLSLPFNEDKYKSLDEISDSLFSNYIEVQKEFDDYHTGWYIKSNILFLGIMKNIISLKSVEEIYTGGANTFYNVDFANFNLTSGKKIRITDIIPKENLSSLEKISKNVFCELKKIKDGNFEKAGYWFKNKKFELNNNFAITDSGLVFFYNLYEIAPRSEGTTQLFIPKKIITHLTKIYK